MWFHVFGKFLSVSIAQYLHGFHLSDRYFRLVFSIFPKLFTTHHAILPLDIQIQSVTELLCIPSLDRYVNDLRYPGAINITTHL